MKDIFERELNGELISVNDPEYSKIYTTIRKTMRLADELNNSYHNYSEEKIKEIFSEIIGKEVDKNFRVFPPFYTDFGKNIIIGKNVLIQQLCTFFDRGGITIGDNVFIGPKVNLITLNHDFNPTNRSATICKPIIIKDNVWIGINSTILQGVTIGENAIIGAGSVVTKDVEANSIVAGNPARFIKMID
ncbi:MAG: sugar O-acetyltransferase [Clostridium perfringens]|nr:sugar O-acetyltransferase [Clostridium perfringens]